MSKAIITNRIYLETDIELQNKLLSTLTYKIPQYRSDLPPKIITTARIVKEGLMSIPSGRMDLIPNHYEIVNRRFFSPVDFPDFKFELRINQSVVHDAIVSDAFINAWTSWGKTFTALKIAGKLREKTLIIVHTLALRDQWVAECEKVYGFTPSIIGSGKFSIDKPITVGNIQTLYRQEPDKLSKSFGTVIVDECHHIPSKSFSSLIDASHARYKIGLSASDKRKDGLHVLFPDYFGTTKFRPAKENYMEPIIHRVHLPIRLNDGEGSWAEKINDLADSPQYQQAIALIAASYASKGHSVLVLASRVRLLVKAHELTPRSICVVGSVKDRKAELQKITNGTAKVAYGSTNIFSEGYSEDILSCLLLGTPLNNDPLLEQLIGRVIRKREGKLTPVIVDPILQGNTATKQANLRKAYYMKQGYRIIDL